MRFAALFLAFACVSWNCRGATNAAASPSLADVKTAVAASSDGDVVTIPAGTAEWDGGIGITNKGLWILGAGQTLTLITNVNTNTQTFFLLNNSSNYVSRIGHMTLSGGKKAKWGIEIDGKMTTAYRLDHLTLTEFVTRAVYSEGWMAGLIDHCTFADCFKTADVYGNGTFNKHDTASWGSALTLGTTNQVVVEDCIFQYENWYPSATAGCSSSGLGGRRTIRFCAFTNNNSGLSFFPVFDAHGNQAIVSGQVQTEPPGGTGTHRGTRQFVCYSNVFHTATTTELLEPFGLRGGTCLIWGNKYTGGSDWGDYVGMREEDGPESSNFLTNYPGYDPHHVYVWNNTVNGSAGLTTADFTYTNDPTFIVEGTNLFWSAYPALSTLTYPHPLVTAQDGAPTPTPGYVQQLNVGTLIIGP